MADAVDPKLEPNIAATTPGQRRVLKSAPFNTPETVGPGPGPDVSMPNTSPPRVTVPVACVGSAPIRATLLLVESENMTASSLPVGVPSEAEATRSIRNLPLLGS